MLSWSGCRWLFVAIALCLVSKNTSAQYVYLYTTINTEPCGSALLFHIGEDNDFLVKLSDLQNCKLISPALERKSHVIDSEKWVDLNSLRDVIEYEYLEINAEIHIMAATSLFGKTVYSDNISRDIQPESETGSLFINYTASFHCIDEKWKCQPSGTAEGGVSLFDSLLLSDFFWSSNGNVQRGLTNLTYDFTSDHSRLQVGDVYVIPPTLGSQGVVAGVGFWSDYSVDPYFIKHPLIFFSHDNSLPARIDVYVNNILIHSYKDVPPGPFELNLRPFMGQSDVRLDVWDKTGRVMRSQALGSYFQAPSILRPGVEEKNLYFGFPRLFENTGAFPYRHWPVFIGAYRRGVREWITLGGSFEASYNAIHSSVDTNLSILDMVELNLAAAVSSRNEGPGAAFHLNGLFLRRPFSIGMDFLYSSPTYSTVLSSNYKNTRIQSNLWTGVSSSLIGSFRLGTSTTLLHDDELGLSVHTGFYRNLGNDVNLSFLASYRHETNANRNIAEFFVAINSSLGNRSNVSVNTRADTESNYSSSIRVKKGQPFDSGLGGFAEVDFNSQQRPSYYANGVYRGDHGILRTDLRRTYTGNVSLTTSLSGSLVLIGGSLFTAKPIQDSYALVKAGEIENARVYFQNLESGQTNRNGEALVPTLLAYHKNKIGLEMRDIPIEYEVGAKEKTVVPRYRSGVVVEMPVTRYHSVTGRALLKNNGELQEPGAWGKIVARGIEPSIVKPDGTFELERLPMGEHRAEMSILEIDYVCLIRVPRPTSIRIDVGVVACEQE